MRKYIKFLFIVVVLAVFGLLRIPVHKWSRQHVNYITAVDDHPLNCLSCHMYTQKDGVIAKLINADYLSPFNMAVSPDGSKLYVIAQEGNTLLVVGTETDKVIESIAVGERPHSVVIKSDGNSAFVSNQWADNVYEINLTSLKIVDTLKTGSGPAELVLSADEKFLYVVDSYSSEVSIIDLQTRTELKRLMAGNNPVAATLSPDRNQVYVTSRRTLAMPYGTPPMTELTVIDAATQRVKERKIFENAYIMENVAFTPSGDMAIATLIRPKNLIPAIQVERGWMMTHGIGIIEPGNDGRIIQLLLDEPNAYYSDPFDIVITPDGEKAFVTHSGVDFVTVIDLHAIRTLLAESTAEELDYYSNHLGISSRYVIKRIPTGANPKGLVLSPDGKYLYVAERLEDRIAVISTEEMETIKTIDLKGPSRITVARKGRRLLNNAGFTFQNQYACYTCHPDSHEDGLVYNMAGKDMGRNLANVQTLRDIGDIPPYKWNGKNSSIYKQDGMRFSTILTRTESFDFDELDALVAYIVTGIKNPPNLRYNPNGELTAAQKRGKTIFYRTHTNCGKEIPVENRCFTCHPPPFFTNMEMADVGTLSETDDPMLFDAPQLNNVYESAPYLHDGRSATLEELWTTFNDEDKHGVGNDMMKDQLNDLVEYLKSLRDAKYYKDNIETYKADINPE
ncbi:MAG: beta-propeller fold lactonase family protein [Bacteroidales bacterium]|nr:beta-propeller fold lactonase family protein [Bacteroidales bacterium]